MLRNCSLHTISLQAIQISYSSNYQQTNTISGSILPLGFSVPMESSGYLVKICGLLIYCFPVAVLLRLR